MTIDTAAVQQVSDDFRLSGNIELISNGNNIIYRVGEHSVRCHTRASLDEVENEMIWLESLNHSDIPHQRPVGTTLIKEHPVSIVTWVEGHHVKTRSPQHFHLMGKLAARLHNHAESWTPPEGFHRWSYDGHELKRLLSPYLPYFPEPMVADVNAMFGLVTDACNAIERVPETFGLCHLDFKQANTLYIDGNHPGSHTDIAPIDFEGLGYAFFLQDVATALNGPSWEPDYEAVRTAFLDGYLSLRPLQHIELIPAFQAGRCGEMLLDAMQRGHRDGAGFAWQCLRKSMGLPMLEGMT
ncbi:MAG: phosphotransferase [Pseudomonadota bacterium]